MALMLAFTDISRYWSLKHHDCDLLKIYCNQFLLYYKVKGRDWRLNYDLKNTLKFKKGKKQFLKLSCRAYKMRINTANKQKSNPHF